MKANLEYDFIIVGSGAAGGIIFNELKKNNKNVLLIEEGNHYSKKNYREEFYYSLKNLWKSSGYQYAIGNISLPLLQGVSIGGSTAINGSIMQKLENTFCDNLEELIEIKNSNFKFENLLKYQDELIEEFKISRDTSDDVEKSPLKKVVEKKDWECNSQLRAAPDYDFSKRILVGNSIENLILKKFDGENIFSNVKVEKIVHEKNKIVGINCLDKVNNKNFFIKVKKKLIISCGAISSARLLMKSKIQNENLGKNFSCHLSGAVDAVFNNSKEKIGSKSMALEIITDDNTCKKFANQNVPDEILLSRLPPEKLEDYSDELDEISSWVYNVSSLSSGYMKKNFFDYDLHYNISENEFSKVKKFIFKISEFLFDIGAQNVLPNIINIHNVSESLKNIQKILSIIKPKDLLLTSSHLFGTSCLGKDQYSGVIDKNFKVFNYDNLFIVDGGIFPFPTSYNPQLTIMIFAKLASDILINE